MGRTYLDRRLSICLLTMCQIIGVLSLVVRLDLGKYYFAIALSRSTKILSLVGTSRTGRRYDNFII
jgi:hypothetical protein